MLDEDEGWFINHYHCPDCGINWADEWSCTCNDECPCCGHEIEPYESEDSTGA
jgi:hypothetical protein